MKHLCLLMLSLGCSLSAMERPPMKLSDLIQQNFYPRLSSKTQNIIATEFEDYSTQLKNKKRQKFNGISQEGKQKLLNIFAHRRAPLIMDLITPQKRADEFFEFLKKSTSCGLLEEMQEWRQLKFYPEPNQVNAPQDLWRLFMVSLIEKNKIQKVIREQENNKQHIIHQLKILLDIMYKSVYEDIDFKAETTSTESDPQKCMDEIYAAEGELLYTISTATAAWRVASFFKTNEEARKSLVKLFVKGASQVACTNRWPNATLPWRPSTLDPRFDTLEKAQQCKLLNAYIAVILANNKLSTIGCAPIFITDNPSHYKPKPPYLSGWWGWGIVAFEALPWCYVLEDIDSADTELINVLKQIGTNPKAADEAGEYSLLDALTALNSLIEQNYFSDQPLHIDASAENAQLWKKNIEDYIKSKDAVVATPAARNNCLII